MVFFKNIWKKEFQKMQLIKEQITPRQLELLKTIATFTDRAYFSPTIAELACKLNISRPTAFEHIGELRKKDMLSSVPGKARSLKLTSKAQELLEYKSQKISSQHIDSDMETGLPFLGRVAAGVPIEAIEDTAKFSLANQFGSSDKIFTLQVAGDSMIEDDIHDGDYVICQRSETAGNGQMVVALLDNENVTLKRFYKEKSHVRLQPSNKDYAPIYSNNLKVQAIVIGLVRKF